ncbi:MAG: CotH kinase family protein [candidate division KSB1 bacterium]|nr:CotH kinase family protein [candidate division KSB1 bacterium]MDZ7368293.1 CotH kinase family protein [candidate division KSB1 bacterium]MDZ7406127.1 CotH kinase family protein [candidate division KSB1 bacterium]
MSFWKNYLCLCSAAALLIACGKIVDPADTDDFGLTKIELTITSEYLGILNSMVFARREVPGRIEVAGERRKVFVRYSGQTSLGQFKKSYTVEFTDGELFRGHKEYVISAQNGDPTKLNTTLGFWAFRQAGLMASEVEPAAVYLNGVYQGLYYFIEPVDEDFLRIRRRRLGSLYEAFNGKFDGAHFSFAGGYDVRLGFESKGERKEFYGDLERLIEILDASTPENLPARIEPLLDVENYLRYLAVSVLFHNWDGYFNNFRLHLDPQIGKFQIIPWDLDNLLELHPTRSRLEGANELSEKLLQVPAYRRRYKQILLELMDEKLTAGSLDLLIDETAAKIARAYAADRVLTAPGSKPLVEHAATTKQFIRDWYAKIRGELIKLD